MKGIIIFGVILFLLVGSLTAYFYFYKQKPIDASSSILYHNLSLKFLDNVTGKEITTEYAVYFGNSLFTKGAYSGSDYNRENIPTNRSF
ncbi:MAG: hypothetical protein AABY22_09525, partial [Nanoarchaeota archaeon]